MIVRWCMALQELDFKLEHIAGKLNTVADWFFRLCFNNMALLPKEYTADDVYLSAILDDFTVPKDKYYLIALVHSSLAGHLVSKEPL